MQINAILFLSVLLPFLSSVVAADSDVIELTENNFEKVVRNTPNILIDVYAPWGGHCKVLAPIYEKAATELKPYGVTLARIDGSYPQPNRIANQYNVQGFPALFFFRTFEEGKIDYDLERSSEDIVKWCLSQLIPKVQDLTSIDEYYNFVSQQETRFVAFYDAESEGLKGFKAAANDIRSKGLIFGALTDTEIRKALEFESGIKMYKGTKVMSFNGTFTKEQIITQILPSGIPSIQALPDWRNYALEHCIENQIPIVLIFPKPRTNTTEILNQYTEVANHFDGKVVFFVVDVDSDRQWYLSRMAKECGASGTKFSTATLVKRRGKLIALDETLELTPETLKTFVTDGLQGKAKAYRKSDIVPAFVLVGKTFEKYVFDETKDVLVKFYKHFESIIRNGTYSDAKLAYDMLADSFFDDPTVLVAKIDAHKNGYPHYFDFEVIDPTLVFFPAKNKTSPVKYEGKHSFEFWREFVLKNKL